MIDKSKSAIEITNVTVKYHNNAALLDASISIPHGTLSGVIGMNGAGKSTLFKVIMGLIAPSGGKVRVCNGSPKDAQKIGCVAYVPQNEVVDWDFPVSVYDVVMMGRYGTQNMFRTAHDADVEKVREALEKVGMSELAGRQIGELSGGQRKRVFVARALAQGAEILLLDEPFAGLDAKSERSLTILLVALKNEGKTVIISTHELTSLSEYCDHVALVKRTVLAYGKTEDVFTRELISETFDGIVHHVQFDK
jgi:ABC-type Mn2+/Zn2+ transport system ATPase subunit